MRRQATEHSILILLHLVYAVDVEGFVGIHGDQYVADEGVNKLFFVARFEHLQHIVLVHITRRRSRSKEEPVRWSFQKGTDFTEIDN